MNIDPIKFTFVAADKNPCPPGWNWNHVPGPKNTNMMLFWLIVGNKATLHDGDVEHQLSPGDCLMMRMSRTYKGRHDPQNPIHVPWILFSMHDEKGNPVVPDEKELPFHRFIGDMSFMRELIDRFFEVYDSKKQDNPEAGNWFKALFLEVVRYDRLHKTTGPVAKLDEICNEIKNRPGDKYRIGDLASRVHCSPDHFIRLFREHRGMTPGEYIINCRIEAGKNLLLYSGMTISQIADHLGYCNPFFLSKQFKKLTGISPKAFRRHKRHGVKVRSSDK